MVSSLYLMPTHKCNCSCQYCYISEDEKKKSGENSIFHQVTHDFVEKLKSEPETTGPQIRFIGGEPYLKPGLIWDLSNKFLAEITQGKVYFNTNGTLIRKSQISSIDYQTARKCVHIISIDGIEGVHNHRRKMLSGDNSFLSAVRGIHLLLEHSFPVYLNMVLDPFTIQSVEDFMKFIKKEFGMSSLSVSLLYDPERIETVDAKFGMLEEVYEIAERNHIELGGHHRLLTGQQIPELKCKAGIKTVLITTDGKMSCCQRLIDKVSNGRKYRSHQKFKDFVDHTIVEDQCYSKDSCELGEKLCQMYKEKYPKYMKLRELDKILFGVI